MKTLHKANVEPPSCQNHVLIGRDSQGHWVVKDEKGLHGGIFADRVQALKFAMHDLGQSLQAVIMMPGILELEMISAKPAAIRAQNDRLTPHRVA